MAPGESEVASWRGVNVPELAERWGVPSVRAFATIGSTNDFARVLAQEGAPAGTTVVADEQLSGRGRAGRPWRSAPGLGLWASMVVRPADAESVTILPLVVGVQAAEALEAITPGKAVGIKWPNDLLIDGRKVGGILCEAAWQGRERGFVVVGIGINVAHAAADFPPELRDTATSLVLSGTTASVLQVADQVIPKLATVATSSLPGGGDLAGYVARDVLRGTRVVVSEPVSGAVLAEGTARGVAADGALLISDAEGKLTSVRAGTVRTITDRTHAR